ncbi:MAG TPA: HEAT repeat domain-containing protein [Longimicrobium sp.]|nr:HEAT repeat domain-containing protein [Longimicrobium sp.]
MKVFLSSTFKDLEPYRAAVIARLRRLDGVEVRCMEDFGARAASPKQFCIDEARECDLFIGLIGHLYGFIPQGDETSITEQEYEAASGAEREMLLFVAPGDFKVSVDLVLDDSDPRKQKKFRERVLGDSVANVDWSTPERLALGVVEAVRNWERARLGVPAALPATPGINLGIYAQRCRTRWDAVDLTALAAPGALDGDVDAPKLSQVFIPQACRRSRPAMSLPRDYLKKQGLDPDEEERLLSELQARWERQERLPALDLLARPEARKLVLLGDPGAGKSSLTRFVLLQLLDPLASPESVHGEWHQALDGHWPVLVELRDLLAREAEGRCEDLLSYLGYVGETQGFGFNRSTVDAQLGDRPSLMIVDGLDEIFDVKRRRRVVEEIIGLETRFPKARVLVTSRIAGFDAKSFEAAGFEIATLDDLDQGQIDVFAEKWFALAFPGEAEKAAQARGDLLETLKRRPQLAAIAGNPLILTIMAIIARHKRLARSRTQLYAQALEVLCYAWDYRRGLELSADSPLVDLEASDTLLMLRRIAWRMQESKEGLRANAISEADLRGILVEWFEHDWRFSPQKVRRAAKEMLSLLQERNWILTTRGPGLYGFVHRTFLEYLCALELTKRFEAQELTLEALRDDYVLPRVDDDSYSEVIRLLCGQLPSRIAEQLIVAICPIGSTLDFDDDRRLLLAWQSLGEMEPRALSTVERACAVILASLTHWISADNYAFQRVDAAEMANGINSVEPGSWPQGGMKNYRFPFSDSRFDNKFQVFQALGRTIWLPDAPLRATLFKLTRSKNWVERRGALMTLSGLSDPNVCQALMNAAGGDRDENVRISAITVLAAGFSTFTGTFDLLINVAAEDLSSLVRGQAVISLAQSFSNHPETFDCILTRAQKDSRAYVRQVAVDELAIHFRHDPRTFETLLSLAGANDPAHSGLAVRALWQHFSDRSETYSLLCKWAEPDYVTGVRRAAFQGLTHHFAENSGVYELMVATADQDANADMRAAAVSGLGKFADRAEVVEVVRRLARGDATKEVRRLAIMVYAKSLGESISALLLTQDLDGMGPWIDPREPVTSSRVRQAAAALSTTENEIRKRFEELVREHGMPLELEWLAS